MKQSMRCPYLDTVNRHMLDFDFEKLCSVSLSNLNVYACLVCGKYFQGISSFLSLFSFL
jgi:U4/U6.U5 tri-snRNP-associated protein 2